MPNHVIPLQHAHMYARHDIGGKAWALGLLLANGFPVPPGFIVPAASTTLPLAPAVGQDILATWGALDFHSAAVRSSADVEDGADRSWAGVFHTQLRVDSASLIAAVTEVISRASTLETHAAVRMSVIIQEMIDADVAGVAFTRHPVQRGSDVVYIEAVNGTGDRLVDGSTTPTSYTLAKQPDSTLALPANGPLTPAQLSLLTATCVAIETLFKAPQDIEWAFRGDQLFILQSRPITV